jgi:hypothetical protein
VAVATDEGSAGGLPVGTGLVMDTAGVGSIAVAGVDYAVGTWRARREARAVAIAGMNPLKLGSVYSECQSTAEVSAFGTGTVSGPAQNGGIVKCDTTATASKTSGFSFVGANGPVSGTKTVRWGFACRSRLSAGDAASTHEMGLSNGLNISANGAAGFVSVNGVTVLRLFSPGTTDVATTGWAYDTTLYHDFEIFFDLTTVSAYIDGVLVASTAVLTNLPNMTGAGWCVMCGNGATAASRTVETDRVWLGFEQAI